MYDNGRESMKINENRSGSMQEGLGSQKKHLKKSVQKQKKHTKIHHEIENRFSSYKTLYSPCLGSRAGVI